MTKNLLNCKDEMLNGYNNFEVCSLVYNCINFAE